MDIKRRLAQMARDTRQDLRGVSQLCRDALAHIEGQELKLKRLAKANMQLNARIAQMRRRCDEYADAD
jgi:hypothetical protein